MAKQIFQQSSVSHDHSEIIIISWFGNIEPFLINDLIILINAENSFHIKLNIFVRTVMQCFFIYFKAFIWNEYIYIFRARNCDHFGRICSRNVICATQIYLGAFVRVQIIAVVRPLQFSAKRSRITAQHVSRDRELKQVKLFIRALV